MRCMPGVAGSRGCGYSRTGEDRALSLMFLERATGAGKSPVGEKRGAFLASVPKYYGIDKPVGIQEDHLLRLNTPWQPIVNEVL